MTVEPERYCGVEEKLICLKSNVYMILLEEQVLNIDVFAVFF